MAGLAAVRYRTRELMSALHALCLLTVVFAEPFYQRRDHLDQNRYQQVHNKNLVNDKQDAQFILSKYGYLRCPIERRERETGGRGRDQRPDPSSDPASSDGAGSQDPRGDQWSPWAGSQDPRGDQWSPWEQGELKACDDRQVTKAIVEYQSTYNLPPTGVLDDKTKRLMSTLRCGNRDHADIATGIEGMEGRGISGSSTAVLLPKGPSSRGSDSRHVREASSSPGRVMEDAQRLWKRATTSQVQSDDASPLLRLLKGVSSSSKHRVQSRHHRHLQQYISKLPRRHPSLLRPWSRQERSRSKRSIQVTATGDEDELRNLVGQHILEYRPNASEEDDRAVGVFNKDVIRWRLLTTGYSTRIPVQDQRATLDLAFRMWSEVIPLRFVEDTDSSINQVDIEIAFGRGSHQDCEHDFDGNGGEIAHSQHAGNMHFDDEENFKSIRSYTPDGIYLLRVAVHEIGHVLGLAHTNRSQSIMYAIYHGAELSPEFELSREDRRMVQKLYGVCKGVFSTVFDWVRRRPDNQFIYNTYFFRHNQYWMYENHANRTRYGDPLYIAREWEGVPNQVDGYMHTWYFTGDDIVDETYFFKGERYYKYDSDNDRVYDGWPRLIQDDFGPAPGQTQAVPDNPDTVFFDMRDKNIYFFKDDMVFVFDPKEPDDQRGCCVRKRRFVEEFPSDPDSDLPLLGNVDAVYYSYGDHMQYFFKGEDLWRNWVFDPHQTEAVNSLQYVGKWYDKWMDICDVQVH